MDNKGLAQNFYRVPPNNVELEQAVLGAILLERDKLEDIVNMIRDKGVFYDNKHQIIYSVIQKLFFAGGVVDILTVSDELSKQSKLDEAGGHFYITKLTMNIVSSANAMNHALIINESYTNRKLIEISGEITKRAYSNEDCFDNMDYAESELSKISVENFGTGVTTSHNAVIDAVKMIDSIRANKLELTGVDTGYRCLNKNTNGWQPADLIIIAARPSVGKTAFALNLALNAAMASTPVAFFSLEMSIRQITNRLLSMHSKIKLEKINRGNLADYEMEELIYKSDEVAKMPIYMDDEGGLNIYRFKSKARAMVKKYGVKLIIIDYLQLMSNAGKKTGNREQEISLISREIKSTAKELNIPIIALSQLSRGIESRSGESKIIPVLSDLRESGAIEQDADMVIFPYRYDYMPSKDDVSKGDCDGKAGLKIAKHRNGALDDIPMNTDLTIQKWYEFGAVPDIPVKAETGFSPALRSANNYDNNLPF